jgi:RHS repeat-associated protein
VLGQQTARTVTSDGGSSARTMGWDYYPDGKLKSRIDDGVPIGKQVVLVDNSDTGNVKATGTWATSTAGTGFHGVDYRTHAAGTGTNTFAWTLNVPQAGTYEAFVKYPAGTATNAPYKIDFNGGTTTKPVNQTTGAGTWVSLGSFSFAEGNTGKITLSDQANGTVVADAVKLVRDNSADVDTESKTYTDAYDPNGNLTAISDSSPGAAIDAYAVTYNGLDQVQQIQEKLAGAVKHTTSYTYDEIGDPLSQTHDAQVDTFSYDVRNLLATVTNKTSASDPSPKVTSYTYTPAGTTATEIKDNGNAVTYDYNLDWSLAHQVEKKPSGSVVAEHTLTYDPNGNKTRDTSSVQNADNHAQMLNRLTVDTYDPRDRSATVTETNSDTGASVSTESYVHDANNNVVSQTLNGTSTSFAYDRNRLQTATSGGSTAGYNYDPFGRLDTVTAAGAQIERYVYDGYDRTVKHTKTGAGISTYAYDPFDRTTSETTDAGGPNEKTTAYAYLGLTNQLLSESVAGMVTKTYQYSVTGQRLSQTAHNTDGSTDTADYGYSPHADVEALTDQSGDTKATYGYTAYGSDTTADFTGLDKPDTQDPTKTPFNVYRYDAKRFDPATGTLDMGFRDYAPGLNRFLTRDSYNGALADQNLTANPWTGNQYAFTGGNPTTNIELDGHEPGSSCNTSSCYTTLIKHGMNPNGPDSLSSCTTACAPVGGNGGENGGPGSPAQVDPNGPLAYSTPEAYANAKTYEKLGCTVLGPVQTCPPMGIYYENGDVHYTAQYFADQAKAWSTAWQGSDPEGYAKFVAWADKTNRYGCHDVKCWAVAAAETAVGLAGVRLAGDAAAGGVPRFEGPLAAEAAGARLVTIGGPRDFDPNALKGMMMDNVRGSIPSDWVADSSKSGGGDVFRDPANPGRQIRIMPGYAAGSRPDPVTTGPYAVVSQNGVTVKIPLFGNPTLP